eukprot:SAG31_NODE_5118_length_2730_cov_6.394147_4_plen_102_part_00
MVLLSCVQRWTQEKNAINRIPRVVFVFFKGPNPFDLNRERFLWAHSCLQVHSKGDPGDKLVFGLYTCGGTKTCVGGRVGSENYWEKDAAAYAEWGVDWCAA